MAVSPWNEEQISALYREYQRERDGIEFTRYQAIRSAAYQMLEQEQAASESLDGKEAELVEAGIQSVLNSASELYPTAGGVESATGTAIEPAQTRLSESRGWVTGKISGLVDWVHASLTPNQWIPVTAVALILLVASPVLLDLYQRDKPDFTKQLASQVDSLSLHGPGLVNEISRLNSWQYGFSSGQDSFSRAFTSGVLIVDLLSLSGVSNEHIRQDLLETLEAKVDNLQKDILGEEKFGQSLDSVSTRLEKTYKTTGLLSAYRLGIWVELNYLRTRLEENIGEINAVSSLREFERLIASLEKDGFDGSALEWDMAQLRYSDPENPTRDELKQISDRLLKLRTLLMISQP